MQRSTTTSASTDFVVTHPIDSEDAPIVAAMRAMASSTRGMLHGIAAREPFDALMESVLPKDDVTFEIDTIGGIPGLWVHPAKGRFDGAILHLPTPPAGCSNLERGSTCFRYSEPGL
ncbi:MAG TPA: hypothetical protein VGJ20_09780 [Xanthobacteraceae bacterium]|jgi:hypothetical protein